MALTIKESKTQSRRPKKYKMLDGRRPVLARPTDRHEALALALSIRRQRKEHDLRRVPAGPAPPCERAALRCETALAYCCQSYD